LSALHQLQVLDVSNNDISGLKATCEVLGSLHKLRRLYIRDNPAANEEEARFYIIYMLPWLEQCDGRVITDAEKVRAEDLSRQLGWMKAEAAPRPKTIETAFGKTYSRPPLPPKVPETSRCERRLESQAAKILAFRGRDEELRRRQLSTCMGAISHPAPIESLAPYGHDTDTACQEALEFGEHFKAAGNKLRSMRRPQSARPSPSGDQPPNSHWTLRTVREPTQRKSRPQTAHPAGIRKDMSITIDSDMYTKFTKTRRQQVRQTNTKSKLFSVEEPTVKISTTQGL